MIFLLSITFFYSQCMKLLILFLIRSIFIYFTTLLELVLFCKLYTITWVLYVGKSTHAQNWGRIWNILINISIFLIFRSCFCSKIGIFCHFKWNSVFCIRTIGFFLVNSYQCLSLLVTFSLGLPFAEEVAFILWDWFGANSAWRYR